MPVWLERLIQYAGVIKFWGPHGFGGAHFPLTPDQKVI